MVPALGGEILNVLTMLGDDEGAVEEKVARFHATLLDELTSFLLLTYLLTNSPLTLL